MTTMTPDPQRHSAGEAMSSTGGERMVSVPVELLERMMLLTRRGESPAGPWLAPLLQGVTIVVVITGALALGNEIGRVNERLSAVGERLSAIERRVAVLDEPANGVAVRLARIEEQIKGLGARRDSVARR